MQTKTKAERVRDAIGECERGFRTMGRAIRTYNERVEELWFEIEARIEAVEAAERKQDYGAVEYHLSAIMRYVGCIESELPT